MVRCGTLYDVYPYEKMKQDRGNDQSPHSVRLADGRKKMPVCESTLQSARLGGGKKTPSFRWISRQSDDVPGSSKREVDEEGEKEQSIAAASSSSPPKKPKDPSKRIGFVDILMGYHSLLQSSPGYPVAKHKRELYPTIGFIQTCGSQ